MIPSYVNVAKLDPGIKPLVISLGRLSNVKTLTNCEGEIWRNTPGWPTKNGWIYFLRNPMEHQKLVDSVDFYCNGISYFDSFSSNYGKKIMQTIDGLFEPHHDEHHNDLFGQMNEQEQEAYFQRAGIRKKELFKGWFDLNQITIDYITDNITKDIESLPYQNKNDGAIPFTMCQAW